MYKRFGFLDVIMRYETEQRLMTTCFRGPQVRKAGNFFAWPSIDKMLEDKEVMPQFLDAVRHNLSQQRGRFAVSGRCSRTIGWVSTVPKSYGITAVEQRKLNGSVRYPAFGLVTSEAAEAPQTHIYTIKYELLNRQCPTAVIHTVYPGVDVGQLRGNVSERTHRVFFEFHNPGSASAICDE